MPIIQRLFSLILTITKTFLISIYKQQRVKVEMVFLLSKHGFIRVASLLTCSVFSEKFL